MPGWSRRLEFKVSVVDNIMHSSPRKRSGHSSCQGEVTVDSVGQLSRLTMGELRHHGAGEMHGIENASLMMVIQEMQDMGEAEMVIQSSEGRSQVVPEGDGSMVMQELTMGESLGGGQYILQTGGQVVTGEEVVRAAANLVSVRNNVNYSETIHSFLFVRPEELVVMVQPGPVVTLLHSSFSSD